MRSDGTELTLVLLPTDAIGWPQIAPAGPPSWSPDGSSLAFGTLANAGGNKVYVVKPDGSGLTALGPGAQATPVWSPDGSRIAFADGAAAVYIASRDGATLRRFGTGYMPAWSPGGTRLAFSKTLAPGRAAVYVADTAGMWDSRVTLLTARQNWPSWRP